MKNNVSVLETSRCWIGEQHGIKNIQIKVGCAEFAQTPKNKQDKSSNAVLVKEMKACSLVPRFGMRCELENEDLIKYSHHFKICEIYKLKYLLTIG